MFDQPHIESTCIGIRGFAEDECSLGPHDLFNSLNFITGFVFLTGLLILILFILLFFFQHIPLAKKIIRGVIIGTVAGSLVLLVGDMIFSFYVASELLPVVEKWERNQSLCNDGIFRSSFGVIVTYFIVICVLMVVGAVILSAWIYRRTRPYRNSEKTRTRFYLCNLSSTVYVYAHARELT